MAAVENVIINQAKISEQVYDYLRGEIVAGQLVPGERLNLEEMAERLKISKMPIKEAIERLAGEGLLEVQARRGTFVSRLDPVELAEIFEVRCALEVLAGELAVRRIQDADLEKLNQLIEEMGQSTGQTNVGRHLELNFQFHGLLVELSHNRKLIEMYHRLRTHIQIAAIHYRSESWVERVAQEQREHRAIVQALATRDTEQVSRAIREHIKRGGTSLLEDVERSVGQE
ncbi:MAG: GntR family transcriptional regulator [Acidobacteria bacterium]|nr:GntR family transcriptional regulator [Acidobacteriota bacterium]